MSKKLNIIEAMKMPINSKFEVILNGEKYGCVAKIIESKVASKKQLVWDNRADTQVFVTDSISRAIFIPIQQPVSFMEAITSGKRIKCVHSRFAPSNNYMSISEIFKSMSTSSLNDFIPTLVNEGKWYIEESEADSNDSL